MLRTILNRSRQQHPTRRQLYGHLPPITKTIQARRTRHAGHCWRSKDQIVSDVLLWTPAYSQSKAGRPARTYIQQLCDDTGCNPEDLAKAMNDRETWRERGFGISMLAVRHDDGDEVVGKAFFFLGVLTSMDASRMCPRREYLSSTSNSRNLIRLMMPAFSTQEWA